MATNWEPAAAAAICVCGWIEGIVVIPLELSLLPHPAPETRRRVKWPLARVMCARVNVTVPPR
jgi:hypothetical protein